jgi:hypothetical protein
MPSQVSCHAAADTPVATQQSSSCTEPFTITPPCSSGSFISRPHACACARPSCRLCSPCPSPVNTFARVSRTWPPLSLSRPEPCRQEHPFYRGARVPDQLVYTFALRHASAYNLIDAGHPSLVAETFCFAPRAKLLSVTVVPSFRPRQPFSLPRWIPRCIRAVSIRVRSSHRPTSPPTSPFPAAVPLELFISHLGRNPKTSGVNSTRLPTRRPTRSGSRRIPCTEPTTPQPHLYPHLIEPRQILWILCGCPTTRKPRVCLHLAGPLQIRPGSFVAATRSAMWAATCAWVSL